MEPEATLINYVKTGNLADFAAVLDQDPAQIHTKHSSGKTLLLLATYYQQHTIVNELIARGAQPDIYEATALGDYKAVRFHIKARPSAIFTRHADGLIDVGVGTDKLAFTHVEVPSLRPFKFDCLTKQTRIHTAMKLL